ncbi:MAG: hypothetical protein V1775_03515, partial [Bacteroidota bacterium]
MENKAIFTRFSSPELIIDERICRTNIHNMAEKARANGLIFRPHFKTHQSVMVGRWFREEGVTAITVASVKMARFFAKAGWKDITIAFPLNIREIEEIGLIDKIQAVINFKPYKDIALVNLKAMNKKKCFYCNSPRTKKNGHKNGIQIFKCFDCKRQFLGGTRINNEVLWHE